MTAYQHREDPVRAVKEVADIVEVIGEHVNLKKSGIHYKGCCPFHSEKTPSFIVSPERKTYHCFGCGEGGDVFTFLMQFHRQSFPEALTDLAGRYNVVLPEKQLSKQDQALAQKREQLFRANTEAARIFHDLLLQHPSAAEARRYLEGRGISRKTIDHFNLGFAPDRWDFLLTALSRIGISPQDAKDAGLIVPREQGTGFYDRFRNRIMFPIHDLSGRVIAFGGRILDDGMPKYMNSPETPVFDKSRSLFGLFNNKEAIRQERRCLLVEGNFDLLALVEQGFRAVAAPMGTALTSGQINTLKGYAEEIILLFDGDSAGLKAAMRAVPLFLSARLPSRVAVLPSGHDPDSYVREKGAESMRELTGHAVALPEFVFDRLVTQHGLDLAGKAKIVEDLRPLVAAIGNDRLQQSLFLTHFSKKLGLTPDQLLQGIVPQPIRPADRPSRDIEKIVLPKKQEQLLHFLLLHAEFVDRFLAAGIEEIIAHPAGCKLLRLLQETYRHDSPWEPEALLDTCSEAERSLLSRLLVSSLVFPDNAKEATAKEMESWLRTQTFKKKRDRLIQQINVAHQQKDESLWMELIEKKKEMDEAKSG